MSLQRLERELHFVRQQYAQVQHGAEFDWVLIKRFPLPPGWNATETDLLVLVPKGYPTTPPDNFYTRTGLRLADGRPPNNVSDGQSVLGTTWMQFSFHAKAWEPASAPEDGDNLMSFLIAIKRRLCEGA